MRFMVCLASLTLALWANTARAEDCCDEVRGNQFHAVKAFLDRYPGLVNYVDPGRNEYPTPLHIAAERGHVRVAWLLLQYGADLKALDHQGRTPVQLAAWNGQHTFAWFLVSQGAELDIFTAAALNQPLLVAAMVRVNPKLATARLVGLTPYDWADPELRKEGPSITNLWVTSPQTSQALTTNGAYTLHLKLDEPTSSAQPSLSVPLVNGSNSRPVPTAPKERVEPTPFRR